MSSLRYHEHSLADAIQAPSRECHLLDEDAEEVSSGQTTSPMVPSDCAARPAANSSQHDASS